jgi:hypothetical protein
MKLAASFVHRSNVLKLWDKTDALILGINEMDPSLDGATMRSDNGAEAILTIAPERSECHDPKS